MKTTHETTADKKLIIKIVFDRQSPEADAPTLEAVFSVYFPENLALSDSSRVLSLLSVTRTDTRESAIMVGDEPQMVMEEASEYAASLTLADFG